MDIKTVVTKGFDKALEAQYPIAVKNIQRLRRVHPDKSPAELVSLLNKFYVGAVTATGAGAGATSVLPNGFVQIPVAAADLLSFLEASVLYTLSVAELSEIHIEDIERRRLLVMSVLAGNSAASAVLEPLIGRTAPYWGKKIVETIPMSVISAANAVLGPRFITKYGAKQGVLILGKQIPLFIGIGIGAGGNSLFAYFIIKTTKKILGPPPTSWSNTSDNPQNKSRTELIEIEKSAE